MDQIELPIVSFTTPSEMEDWLDVHPDSTGFWLRFYKKNSGKATISYDEAVEVALCFGWIDSQVKKYDSESYLQKFSPRRKKSLWSKVNTEKAERLIKETRMRPAGLLQVEEAKKDGRWEAAYLPASTIKLPEDFLQELSQNNQAFAFFQTLNKANTYAIAWRLQTARKAETRKSRMEKIISMLEKGERFH